MKIAKALGIIVLAVGVFAFGYWQGQSNTKPDYTAPSQSSSEATAASGSMKGHDMS